MGIRIDRTLKNWRWWVVAPVWAFVGVPLGALLYVCEITRNFLVWLSGVAFEPMYIWMRRGPSR